MAIKVQKKKTPRVFVRLACPKCGRQNYTTTKNKTTTKERLVLKKYCPWCKKHTEHQEVKRKS